MRSHASAAAILIGQALLAGLQGCAGPGAITMAPGIDMPSSRSANTPDPVASRRGVNQVRLGHGLDIDGKVPPSFAARRFAERDPIHLSMGVAEAPSISSVRVSVRDVATDQVVWSGEKEMPSGDSYLSFEIGRGLARGRYRADVIIADEVVSQKGFEVFDWKE